MHVVVFAVARDQVGIEILAHLGEEAREVADRERGQGVAAILGDKDQMRVEGINDVPSLANIGPYCHDVAL